MIFHETKLKGAYIIQLQRIADERGFFARLWCGKEMSDRGLCGTVCQVNIGHSIRQGTLRGMHFQIAPYAEVKLVQCTRGAVYDVIVDLRFSSPTCGEWIGVELSPDNGRMVYVPEGFAHGYQTLVDDTDLVYQTSQVYNKEAARGVRYDDPHFSIKWPLPVSSISNADKVWPDYTHEMSIKV